jgi:uncharacterized protein (TIGR03437 family)
VSVSKWGFALGTCLALLVPLQAQPSRNQQRHEELQFVVSELPERHIDFFAVTPKSTFQTAADQLDSAIPELSDEEFYVRLSTLVALGPDAHTSLGLFSPAAAAVGFNPLPLLLRWLDDGVFVTAASADYLDLNRAKLLRIGDTPVEQALDLLRPVLPHENEYWFRSIAAPALRYTGILRGLRLVPAAGPSPLTFRLATGEERTVGLEPGTGGLIRPATAQVGLVPVTLERLSENYWWEYWSDSRTLFVAYRVCAEMPNYTIAQFSSEIARAAAANPVDTLIFDLRGNSGGNSSFFTSVITTLQSSIVGLRRNPRFQVYCEFDRGTFSSGLLAAEDLKRIVPQVVTVGEPTGGKPTSFGEVLNFLLPHSGLSVQYSTKLFTAPANIPNIDALYPDQWVSLRSTDYFARHDAPLAAVLARAGPPPPPPSGSLIVVNAASYRVETGIAPDSIATGFGSIPQGALDLRVNGEAATVFSRTPGQISFLIPAATAPGAATIELMQGGSSVATGQFTVTAAGLGLFIVDAANNEQPGAVLNEDSRLNDAGHRATRGSIVQIFATGSGDAANVWIAQHPATVVYSGPAPGFAGLWQLNARVPDDPTVQGEVPVFVSVGGLVSNGVTLWVE